MNSSLELQTAIKAAQAGGKIALKYFHTKLDTKTKSDNTFVTNADIETEEVIKKYILKTYPEAKFLAEESSRDTNEEDFWIIDPIDGTVAFIKDIPQWAILIAHYKNKEVTAGVCYIPTQNILLYAEKGKGAYLNGKLATVSKTATIKLSFGNFGSIRHFIDPKPILKLIDAGIILRSYESCLGLSFLASGQMDVIIDGYGKIWDYAPFIRIILEAGGRVTDFEGKPWNLNSKNLVATNGLLHDQILKVINEK